MIMMTPEVEALITAQWATLRSRVCNILKLNPHPFSQCGCWKLMLSLLLHRTDPSKAQQSYISVITQM